MLGRNLSIFSWSSYVQFANVWKTDDTHDDEWRRPWRPSISCDNCIKVTHCTRIMWDYLISSLFCNIFGHVSLPTYSARRSLTTRLSLIHPLLLDRYSQLLTITCLLLTRGGYSPIWGQYRYVPPQRVWFFEPFWSENGYRFWTFWSEIGYGYRGNVI